MGFHAGELAVQGRAGVLDEAARLSGMLEQHSLSRGVAGFLAEQTLAALTARDADGRLWTSPLIGEPGFLDGDDAEVLRIAAVPRPGDPLAGLVAGQQVGLVVIDLAHRRRVRVNGLLAATSAHGLSVDVGEAFGNCPQYIQMRDLSPLPPAADDHPDVRSAAGLTPQTAAVLAGVDTFFLGTVHAERGVDSSHRGGPPGFLRVDGATLWWPDYPGNNMFNSFGNLELDPSASVLVVDFDSGATVHLSGTATLEWTRGGGDDGGTGRRVRFSPERVVHVRTPLPVAVSPVRPYSRNPTVTAAGTAPTEETA